MIHFNLPQAIYPPCPQQSNLARNIGQFDNGHYYAQAQFGGESLVVVVNGNSIKVYNRRGKEHFQVKRDVINQQLNTSKGTIILAGEYVNRNRIGELDKPFQHKFVIWDILAHNNQWLVGQTFKNRADILRSLFPATHSEQLPNGQMLLYKYILKTELPDVYLAANIEDRFDQAMAEVGHIPAYDGIILKKKFGILQPTTYEGNNANWQLKFKK